MINYNAVVKKLRTQVCFMDSITDEMCAFEINPDLHPLICQRLKPPSVAFAELVRYGHEDSQMWKDLQSNGENYDSIWLEHELAFCENNNTTLFKQIEGNVQRRVKLSEGCK